MGQSVKALVQLVLVGGIFATIIAWIMPRPDSLIWEFRLISPLVAIVVGLFLWRYARRKEILPDLLGQTCGSYFERDGFCYGFVPVVIDDICWMQIFFQNRYEKSCHARVVLQPPMKSFSFGRVALKGIDVDIECDGGTYGVCRIPWPISANLQGRVLTCEIACSTSYPNGGGRLLRYREGMRAGSPSSGTARAVATAGLLLAGVVSISRPATVRLQLPTGVLAALPPDLGSVCEILWRPDLPTGGFPIIANSAMPSPPDS